MMLLLADGAEGFPEILGLLGRFHPAVVHFPIGIFAVATLVEIVHALRKKPGTAPGGITLTLLGAVAAIVATLLGWFAEEFDNESGVNFDRHKWIGIAAMVVTIVAAACAWRARSPKGLIVYRASLVVGCFLILLTGNLGGKLIDPTRYERGFSWAPQGPPPPPVPPPPPSGAVGDKVDFARDIAPIFKASCLECHGPKKNKGKFRLDTKEAAFKGGNQKTSIVPGNPDKSLVYSLLLVAEPEDRMPPDDKGPLPKDKIELIKKWIAEGAVWPDGVLIQ